jgi:hypothetical protein
MPTYMTAGYELETLQKDEPTSNGPTFYPANSEVGRALSYFQFAYPITSDGTPIGAHINVDNYQAPAQYQPPQDCGIDPGGLHASPCQLIGSSTSGCKVYLFATDDSPPEYFCRLKDVVILIQSYGSPLSSDQDYNDVIKIFNSLRPISKQELVSKYAATTSSY